ncbi:uncharacterized protein GIQ15_01395 [Arthroderma uncinatum]|uniref:uncharacterized protein n=1 Tax=Arthroderma uncinatum TaxID=74035 RepID=UPI00144AB056|nr:uncharacterized protein GIQ15_01395 [Arthroderma uncinatum]KAF3491878.1 hypothetical protein GIQ15_01395 [Arthroderma uncinatum]
MPSNTTRPRWPEEGAILADGRETRRLGQAGESGTPLFSFPTITLDAPIRYLALGCGIEYDGYGIDPQVYDITQAANRMMRKSIWGSLPGAPLHGGTVDAG